MSYEKEKNAILNGHTELNNAGKGDHSFERRKMDDKKMNIQIVQGDITKQTDVEAIVNAANKSLLGGKGNSVDGAIHRAAGKELLTECRTLKGCDIGEAKITGAYKLPCKYVIHTVGPNYRNGYDNEALFLANAYRNSMKIALNNGIRSIAFPSISTGKLKKYPLREATEIAVKTVAEFYKNHLDAFDFVRFVVFNSTTKIVYDEVLQTIDRDLEHHSKDKEDKKIGPDNVGVIYNRKYQYRGINYEVSVDQDAHPSICTACRKEVTEKALINVHGEVFITCSKCASKAIDTALDSHQKQKKDNRTNYGYDEKKYSSLRAYIDVLINATNDGKITWKAERTREENREITTFSSTMDNIQLQVSRYGSYVQYTIIVNENNRIGNSYLQTLYQAIQKSDKTEELPKMMKHNQLAPKKMPAEERLISVKDFVVRRSVFKCMNKGHELKTVLGIVTVIDSNGREKQVKVNAGYCANCKIFFILESAYEKIRKHGIPLCRTSDEKNYLKQTSVNGMMLAQESILMQYGYTVNQTVGLSFKTRQKILATLIDYKILGKSEIISYLDFFISQREAQAKYKYAIAKWEEDREFVENYKKGTYQQYYVSGITRK